MDKDSEPNGGGLEGIVVLLICIIIAMILWNLQITDRMEELELRHDQLEQGLSDFMDEYYRTELFSQNDTQGAERANDINRVVPSSEVTQKSSKRSCLLTNHQM